MKAVRDNTQSMEKLIALVEEHMRDTPKLAAMFRSCFPNTWQTTLQPMPDGTTFVITGDIPAMWLRDSALQVRTYLLLAREDAAISDTLAGVVRRQMAFINLDPYANAFNAEPNGHGHQDDQTDMQPGVWERKYEIDSLCYPLQLAYLFWKSTGRSDIFDATFTSAAGKILDLWQREQRHSADSPYSFVRRNCPPTDTLSHQGRGAPVAEVGLTWSGFRPSDDACTYGYLVPANMFAVVVLGYLEEIATMVLGNPELARRAAELRAQIDAALKTHAIVEHEQFGPIFAYEVDGFGNNLLMDDANVPSLLSLPYLGYCDRDDPLYRNTRRFILSRHNPFFFEGRAAAGVGSPHTPPEYIWHIALAMQGLTSSDPAERRAMLDHLAATDAGTGYMHEGFHKDDPRQFTRPWFAWANAMFSELVLLECGLTVAGSPLQQGR
ncbi:MAG TPA: glycoside hydrolase family 125 protein [Roseiflexaceae bacterium]|nr:glycoside hydrolase family 125 protein [Roseiflexaceae bacterium]